MEREGTPGGPWMRAISGAEREKRMASFWESFSVSSKNLMSFNSVTFAGLVCPNNIFDNEERFAASVSLSSVIVSAILLKVTSFASFTLNLMVCRVGHTANTGYQN
jgi:hypothetical protein